MTLFRGCCCINDAYFYLGASLLLPSLTRPLCFVSPKTFFKTIITASSRNLFNIRSHFSTGVSFRTVARCCSIDMLRRWSAVQAAALHATKSEEDKSGFGIEFTSRHSLKEDWTVIWDRWEMCCYAILRTLYGSKRRCKKHEAQNVTGFGSM